MEKVKNAAILLAVIVTIVSLISAIINFGGNALFLKNQRKISGLIKDGMSPTELNNINQAFQGGNEDGIINHPRGKIRMVND